jgi:hypothetical protein
MTDLRVGAVALALGVAGCPAEPSGEPDQVPQPQLQLPASDVVALLGGLEIGERIAGWEVLGFDGPREDAVRIELGRDQQRFAIMVARLGVRPELPPVTTERYAVYYGHAHPPETRIPDGAIRAVTHAFGRRIRGTEHDVPVPAGL